MKKRLEDMTLDEVEDLLGPGVLVPEGDQSFFSRRWQCSRCERLVESDVPIDIPAPCTCGGIVFLRLQDVVH